MPSRHKKPMTTEKYPFERYLNVRNASGPTFSADGRHLSFLTDITGVAEVWGIPVDVQSPPAWPEQLSFRGERVSRVLYSPAGSEMLVTADSGGSELDQLY